MSQIFILFILRLGCMKIVVEPHIMFINRILAVVNCGIVPFNGKITKLTYLLRLEAAFKNIIDNKFIIFLIFLGYLNSVEHQIMFIN